jgi:hypothetical protein
MHDDKVDCPIRVGICHFLFDQGYTWEGFTETYPLSIWVACNSGSVRDIKKKMLNNLTRGNWHISSYSEGASIPVLIAHNAAFRAACDAIGATVYEGE